jgi:hypothetical protein
MVVAADFTLFLVIAGLVPAIHRMDPRDKPEGDDEGGLIRLGETKS